MADRDYRITYKTRELDRNEARPRIPTALDPYMYPDDRDELKRSVALARVRASRHEPGDRDPRDFEVSSRRETTVRDDGSVGTATAKPSATKTTYSVTSAGLEKESEVTLRTAGKTREPTLVATGVSSPTMGRRSEFRERDDVEIEVDRQRTSVLPVRTAMRASTRNFDDREVSRVERVYDVERPRKENGIYVIDARDADVYVAGNGRGYGGYDDDQYDDGYRQSRGGAMRPSDYRESEVVYTSRNDDHRFSAPSLYSGAPYMSGARSERAPTTARSSRTYEDDRRTTIVSRGPTRQSTMRREEDDFTIIERRDTRAPSVRETFKDPFETGAPSAAPETPRGRTRLSMASMSPSEDEYVMVSPPSRRGTTANAGRASSTGENLRSSILKTGNYSAEDRERRRSRSISFRAHEADDHYCGDKFHQPPGQEAAICGPLLQNYGGERSGTVTGYSSRNSRRDDKEYGRRSRSTRGMEEYDYEKRDLVKYDAPREPEPRRARTRSRRRRRSTSDDESWVSKNYEKTTKTTYY